MTIEVYHLGAGAAVGRGPRARDRRGPLPRRWAPRPSQRARDGNADVAQFVRRRRAQGCARRISARRWPFWRVITYIGVARVRAAPSRGRLRRHPRSPPGKRISPSARKDDDERDRGEARIQVLRRDDGKKIVMAVTGSSSPVRRRPHGRNLQILEGPPRSTTTRSSCGPRCPCSGPHG